MPFSVECPECRTSLEVDDAHREWKVRCPQCRHEFRPAAVAPAYELVADDDEDADEEAPRRRKRRRRLRDDDYDDPERGAEEIAKPAFALELTGWIYLLISLALCAGLVIFGIVAGDQPNQPQQQQRGNAQNDDPPEMFVFFGCCLAVFTIPYFVPIIYGARKMRHLTSQGWGQASAIMAIATIVLFGVLSFPIMGIGIWAIVAMNKPDVKAAFKQKRRYRPDDDDYD